MFKGPDQDIEFIYTAPSSAVCGVTLDVGGKKEYLIAGKEYLQHRIIVTLYPQKGQEEERATIVLLEDVILGVHIQTCTSLWSTVPQPKRCHRSVVTTLPFELLGEI